MSGQLGRSAQIADRHLVRVAEALSPVNHATWLQKLWLVTVFLLLCGFGLFAVPLGGLNITAGRMALGAFLYLFVLTLLLHFGKVDLRIKIGRYVLFFAIWLLWAIFTLFWSPVTMDSARHIEALIIGCAIILFSLLFLSDEDGIRSLHRLWVIATAIFIAIAIWEVVTGMHLTSSGEQERPGIYPRAVFWNPNDFATFLCLALPFMFCLLHQIKGTVSRVSVVILMLASMVFIVKDTSRANIIASVIGGAAILLIPGVTRRFKSIFMVLLVAGVVFLAAFTLFNSYVTPRLYIISTLPEQITSISGADDSTTIRMDLIRNGLSFLQDSHYLGVGPGGFEYWMTERPVYYTAGIINAHNWWVEMLVNYGVVLFLIFVVFYVGLLSGLLRVFRRSQDQALKGVSLAAFVALLEFPVASMSSSGLIRNYSVWLLLATALCVINCFRLREGKNPDKRQFPARAATETEVAFDA